MPRIKNKWHNLNMCVGVVLLNQWKQGYTIFSKTRKRPLEIGGLFFMKGLSWNIQSVTLWFLKPTLKSKN